ncbi:hypothetical protein Tco_0620012 [Tanacetum coccineum]
MTNPTGDEAPEDHNKRNKASPIRLNFEMEDPNLKVDRIVKGKEVEDGDLIVPADSSSNVPADYVSAGHVLVPADRDRIC